MGISFGVVIGKEVFGGTGKNFSEPGLDAVVPSFTLPTRHSSLAIPCGWRWMGTAATPLSVVASDGMAALQRISLDGRFRGAIPGSCGRDVNPADLDRWS